jgi:hypothetical protein
VVPPSRYCVPHQGRQCSSSYSSYRVAPDGFYPVPPEDPCGYRRKNCRAVVSCEGNFPVVRTSSVGISGPEAHLICYILHSYSNSRNATTGLYSNSRVHQVHSRHPSEMHRNEVLSGGEYKPIPSMSPLRDLPSDPRGDRPSIFGLPSPPPSGVEYTHVILGELDLFSIPSEDLTCYPYSVHALLLCQRVDCATYHSQHNQ